MGVWKYGINDLMSLKLFAFVRQWGWVVVCVAVIATLYDAYVEGKRQQLIALKVKLADLEEKKKILLKESEELLLAVQSQSDPEWIQLTLMKGLGLVPEGQKKVYFKPAK